MSRCTTGVLPFWRKPLPRGIQVLTLALLTMLSACDTPPEAEQQVIYLIRHAEKAMDANNDDPPLLPEGEARARQLAALLKDIKVDRIYSTPYRRNLATVAPLAEAQKAPVKHYEWHDWQPALNEIRANQDQLRTVVICGHGDNLLPMIESFGCPLPIDSMGHQQYDVYFKVSLSAGECRSELLYYNQN